jgi:PAS fold
VRAHAHRNALASAIRTLAAEASPACLLDTRGTVVFVNEAWDRHAAANGGAPRCLGASLIGTSWLDHIAGDEVKEHHARLLERALRPAARPPAVVHVAESNTPTTAALVSTRLAPVLDRGEPLAVSVVHSVVRERPIAEVYEVVHGSAEDYRGAGGELAQCSCCRRVRDPADASRWDLVPELLTSPPRATHVLCELCAELHYPREDG